MGISKHSGIVFPFPQWTRMTQFPKKGVCGLLPISMHKGFGKDQQRHLVDSKPSLKEADMGTLLWPKLC